jgi:hypothetical protein
MTYSYRKLFYLIVFVNLMEGWASSIQAQSLATDFFRSIASGDWTSTAVWESSPDNTSWIPATLSPNFNSSGIVIRNGHTIDLNSSVTIDQTVIDFGGTLILNGANTLNITDGAGIDFRVNGTFQDNASASGGVSFSPTVGGLWELGANGTLIRSNSSSASPYITTYFGGISTVPSTANWIIRYQGTDVPFLTEGMIYPNLTFESNSGNWNPVSSSSRFSGSSTTFTIIGILGNLDIGGTGSGTVNIYNENTSQLAGFPIPLPIQGDLTIRSGSTLTNNGSATGNGFALGGDLINNGTLVVNAGGLGNKYIVLGGFGNSEISGTGSFDIAILRILKDNASLKVTQNVATLSIKQSMSIETGDFDLNGNILSLGTTGLLSEDYTNGDLIIDGTATDETNKGGYVEAIGTACCGHQVTTNINNDFAGLGLFFEAISTYNDITVKRYQYQGDGLGIKKVFEISGNAGAIPTKVAIRYANDDVPFGLSPINRIFRKANTGDWVGELTQDLGGNKLASINSFTSFSSWTLGSTSAPLPIQLLSFTAQDQGNQQAELHWQLASVVDCEGFEIEKSTDNQVFTSLGKVDVRKLPGANQSYRLLDRQFNQSAYYRLKILTESGYISQAIYLEPRLQFEFFPNPISNHINLQVSKNEVVNNLYIIDNQGFILKQFEGEIAKIENQLNQFLPELKTGIYFLKWQCRNQVITKKMIKL